MTGSSRPPPSRRILETALYVEDLDRARSFYETVMGLEVLFDDQRLVAMDAGGATVLLLFLEGASAEGGEEQGAIPGHDARGSIHLAFAVDATSLDAWRSHMDALGIRVESERSWPRGGTSLYFRDPDGHLVELATPGIWTTY